MGGQRNSRGRALLRDGLVVELPSNPRRRGCQITAGWKTRIFGHGSQLLSWLKHLVSMRGRPCRLLEVVSQEASVNARGKSRLCCVAQLMFPIGNISPFKGVKVHKHSRTVISRLKNSQIGPRFPSGNMEITDSKSLGETIRATRKRLKVTQKDLALASGTGLRFIIELEQGKATCQVGKVLGILQALGLRLKLVES